MEQCPFFLGKKSASLILYNSTHAHLHVMPHLMKSIPTNMKPPDEVYVHILPFVLLSIYMCAALKNLVNIT